VWARRVTAANTSDQAGFRAAFLSVLPSLTRAVRAFADRGYRGLGAWLVGVTGGHCLLEVVGAAAGQRGFAVQPKRWVVERTISWLNWSRRLSKDYEQTPSSSEAWVDVSAIRCTLRKLET
jgi:putative transposase